MGWAGREGGMLGRGLLEMNGVTGKGTVAVDLLCPNHCGDISKKDAMHV